MILGSIPMAVLGSASSDRAEGKAPPDGGGGAQGTAGGGSDYIDPATIVPKFWVEPDRPYSPPPVTASRDAGRGINGYAVLCGINAYPSSPLQGCISDITAIRDKLVNSYGWDNRNIHFLTDDAVTPQRITSELQWLASVADPGSQTVFSFSGHGSPHTILAYPSNGVSDDTLAAELKKFNSTENICILDSCFSGANTAVNISNPDFISMMACGPGETASDGSTFTKAWVEGLGTTQWGNVEEAFQYAYNKIQGWQHPVMWDNVPGEMMIGRKPPVIAELPELTAAEDHPITFCFTPYESDPVDGNALLNWTAEWWNASAVRAVQGQCSANDTLTFVPAKDWNGRTTVTLVLTNGARRTAKANITLTWTPVNDPPFVTRLDRLWPSVERTKGVKLIVYGGDVDNEDSTLGLEVAFRPQGGNWTPSISDAEYVVNRWEFNFTPPPASPTGWADFRARLKDLEGWGEWTGASGFLEILNSPPKVDSLAASFDLVHRTQPIALSVFGSDPENSRELLACELDVKSANDTAWTRLTRLELSGDRWEAAFTPPAVAPLGPYDLRARLKDADGLAGSWRETDGLFIVENAIPVLDSLELSAPSVCRGGNVTVTVRGSDVEDAPAALLCDLQYQVPSGEWARIEPVRVVGSCWEAAFQPAGDAELGDYAFRALLRDTSGQMSDWLFRNSSLAVVNSLPAVSGLNFSKGSLFRTQNLSLRVEGRDYEDKRASLTIAVECRPAGGPGWSPALLSEMKYDPRLSAWTGAFAPSAGAPLGDYEFRARLRDRDGDWGEWFVPSQKVPVLNNPPIAGIAPHAGVVNERSVTSFDGSLSSDIEGAVDLEWDFGDGASAQGDQVSHTYTRGGPMTVTLSVTDADGETAEARLQLRVNLLPAARADYQQSGGVHDYRVTFNGTFSSDSEGKLSSYSWDFDTSKDTGGDGIRDNDDDSSSPCPTFDYGGEGTYIVRLTVVDADNGTATTLITVKVRRVDPDSSWMVSALLLGVVVVAAAAGAAYAVRRKRKGEVEVPAGEPPTPAASPGPFPEALPVGEWQPETPGLPPSYPAQPYPGYEPPLYSGWEPPARQYRPPPQ